MAWTTDADGQPVNWLARKQNGVVNFALPGEDFAHLSLRERLKRVQEYHRICYQQSGMRPSRLR